MLKNIRLFISIALLCSTCISIATVASEQDAAKDQVNTFVQEMMNYFNNHPLSDRSGNPISIQDILGQVEKSGEQAFKAASRDVVAKPASVVSPAASTENGHADINLNNKANAAPADIPIALAAGIPASVAAAAAMPPNVAHVASNPAPVQVADVISPAAAMPPVAPQAASPMVPAADVPVAPAEPAITPIPPASSALKPDTGISAAAEPVNNKAPAAEPNIVNPQVIGNAAITPITTIYASTAEPSVTVIVPSPASGTTSVSSALTGSPTAITTATVSRTHSMNTTGTSTTATIRSSSSNSSPTTIIPPISSGNKNDARIALLFSLVGLVSLFYHL